MKCSNYWRYFMVKNLRPREVADALGIGLSTFWLKAKTDPDFPVLISLGARTTVVEEQDLQAYMQKLRDRQATRDKAKESSKSVVVPA
jgi:prophage regulatory protein